MWRSRSVLLENGRLQGAGRLARPLERLARCLGAKHRSASLMLIHRVQLREERRRLHIYIFGCNLRVQESERFWAVSPGTIGNRTSSKVESFWLVSIETTGNRSSCNKSSHFGGVSVRDHLKDGIYCCHTCRSHQSPILFQYLQRWDATLSTGPCGPAKILRFQVPTGHVMESEGPTIRRL